MFYFGESFIIPLLFLCLRKLEVESLDRDLFERLSNQSIQKYLDLKGIGYTRNGNYLKLMDHDSLVIDTRITDQKKCETFFGILKVLVEICINL